MDKLILAGLLLMQPMAFGYQAPDKCNCDTKQVGNKIEIEGTVADRIYDSLKAKETASAEGQYIKPHFYKKVKGVACERDMGGGETRCIIELDKKYFHAAPAPSASGDQSPVPAMR